MIELQDVQVVHIDPPATTAAPAKTGDASAPAEESKETGGVRIDNDFNFDMGGLEIPTLKKRFARFNQLSSADKERQITDGVLRYGPYAMFVLLPAFALLLKLVYLGRGRRHPHRPRLYAEHIVFAAHNHAFLFVGIVAATVFIELLRGAVLVWMLVYMIWSMRAVYRGSWLGIALRSGVLLLSYAVLFGLVTAGLLTVAVLLR